MVFPFITTHWLLVTAFVIALFALIIMEMRDKGLASNIRLSPTQVTRLINNDKAVVVDVRDLTAYNKGHITRAINLPALTGDKDLPRLEQYKQQPVIIVRAMGQKSGHFVNKLRKQGYKAYLLAGGMAAWTQASMPVVK